MHLSGRTRGLLSRVKSEGREGRTDDGGKEEGRWMGSEWESERLGRAVD